MKAAGRLLSVILTVTVTINEADQFWKHKVVLFFLLEWASERSLANVTGNSPLPRRPSRLAWRYAFTLPDFLFFSSKMCVFLFWRVSFFFLEVLRKEAVVLYKDCKLRYDMLLRHVYKIDLIWLNTGPLCLTQNKRHQLCLREAEQEKDLSRGEPLLSHTAQLIRGKTPIHWFVDTAGQSAVDVDYFYALTISLGCTHNQFLSWESWGLSSTLLRNTPLI